MTAQHHGLVKVGLEGDVCLPENGFAVYRALGGPKEMHAYPRCAHHAGLLWVMPKVADFLDQHLSPEKRDD
nr:acetylxylan esterase [Kibdelosporangium phytohabitans]